MATFRKNKGGEWVVFGTVSEVKPGRVMVTKKDGRRQPVEVSSVGRPFFANGEQMVYGYIAPKAARPAPKTVTVDEVSYDVAESREEDAEIVAERRINCEEAGFDMSGGADIF